MQKKSGELVVGHVCTDSYSTTIEGNAYHVNQQSYKPLFWNYQKGHMVQASVNIPHCSFIKGHYGPCHDIILPFHYDCNSINKFYLKHIL